jgi:SPP1 gp7 family putative phage head morphogenesis protein
VSLRDREAVFAQRLGVRALEGARRGVALSDDDLWDGLHRDLVACAIEGFRGLPQDQKRGVERMYESVARSAVGRTKASVRDALLRDVLELHRLPPSHRARKLRLTLHNMGIRPGDGGVYRTLVRAHQAIASNGAAWIRTIRDPSVWGYEYLTAEDERVRPGHAALDGVRYPKGSRFWRKYLPPNGWNCRCKIRVVHRGDDDAWENAFDGTPDIDPQFGFNPGLLLQGLLRRG